MPQPYSSHQTQLLERHAQLAAEAAANAQKPSDLLAVASVDAEAAAETYLKDFSPGAADLLVQAQNRVRDIAGVVDVIESFGGPSEAKIRALSTPAVFSAFRKGFEEKIEAISKLAPGERKRLGARRAELTDAGIPAHEIEKDLVVHALVMSDLALTNHINALNESRIYAATDGVNRTPRSFETLLGELTAPLPEVPATAA
jgi:hypothetical protein